MHGSLVVIPIENDTDPDGDPFIFAGLATNPQHGTLTGVNPGGQYDYLPNPGYVGTDSFTYTIRDNLFAYATGTVTLYVIGDGENDGKVPCESVGEPVNVTNGNMYLQQNDFHPSSLGAALDITRTFNSNSTRIGLFGRGWSSAFDESIIALDNSLVRLNEDDGRATYFGRPVGSSGAFIPLEADFHGSVIQNTNGFTLTLSDGTVRQFNSAGKLLSLSDRNNNSTSLTYGTNGFLSSVTNPFGRVLTVTTNANGRVTSISDTIGTIASYIYGGANQLLSVTYADNSGFQFSYDGNLRLTTITDALGNIVKAHTYDGQGRALTSEKHGGVERYTLSYVNGTRTDVTDALGRITKYTFDGIRRKPANECNRSVGIAAPGSWLVAEHPKIIDAIWNAKGQGCRIRNDLILVSFGS